MSVKGPPAGTEEFEQGLIEVFSDLADLFGNPRSHGMIYGYLFAATEPRVMEAIAKRLEISMGSASMGLRVLEGFGAVIRNEPTSGGRGQSTYQARMELRPLIKGFVKNRLVPKLEASNQKLKLLKSTISGLPPAELTNAQKRLDRITNWHQRAAQLVGTADKVLGVLKS